MKQSDILDIVLLLRLSKGSGRDILHGFSTAARRMRARWALSVVSYEDDSSAETVRRALVPGADGLVAHGLIAGFEDAFASFPGPLVFIGQIHPALVNRSWPTAFVHVDDEASGRMGAEYLMSLGRFRTWGFVSAYGIFSLAQKRLQGFRNRLAEKGFKVASARDPGGQPCARLARCCPRRVPRPEQGRRGGRRGGFPARNARFRALTSRGLIAEISAGNLYEEIGISLSSAGVRAAWRVALYLPFNLTLF